MKLSIITINFNNLEGLKKTFVSVVNQTFNDYEWIVIDGGSSDGSREFIERNAERFSYWCSEPDGGVYDAMNKGLLKAKGDYYNFLNSGDCYCNEEVLEKVFSRELWGDVIYGNVYFIDEQGDKKSRYYMNNVDFNHYLNRSFINHQASFIRKELFVEKKYDVSFKISADTEFFAYSLVNGAKFQYIDMFMVDYQLGGLSDQDHWRCYLDEQKAVRKNLCEKYMPNEICVIYNQFYKKALYQKLYKILSFIISVIDKFIR